MQDKRRGYHQLTDPEGESAGYRKPDHGNGEGKWETGENQRLRQQKPNVYHMAWKRRTFVTSQVNIVSFRTTLVS